MPTAGEITFNSDVIMLVAIFAVNNGFYKPSLGWGKAPIQYEGHSYFTYDVCPSSQQKDESSFNFLLGKATLPVIY